MNKANMVAKSQTYPGVLFWSATLECTQATQTTDCVGVVGGQMQILRHSDAGADTDADTDTGT